MLCRGVIWFESFSCSLCDSWLKNDCYKTLLWPGEPDVPICGGVGLGAAAEYDIEIGCFVVLGGLGGYALENGSRVNHEKHELTRKRRSMGDAWAGQAGASEPDSLSSKLSDSPVS